MSLCKVAIQRERMLKQLLGGAQVAGYQMRPCQYVPRTNMPRHQLDPALQVRFGQRQVPLEQRQRTEPHPGAPIIRRQLQNTLKLLLRMVL